jgi:hypothetical protein
VENSMDGTATYEWTRERLKALIEVLSFSLLFVLSAGATAIAQNSVVGGTTNTPPLAGCYERVYDPAHLAGHKGQLVTRATLSISVASPEMLRDNFIAEGDLKIWVRGIYKSFDSLGVCRAEGHGLICNGSVSAGEADDCKSKRDGVRQCRIYGPETGSFQVASRPDGVLVTIRERLELVPAPCHDGPWLYLSPTNAENRAFLLKRAFGICTQLR